MIAGGVIAALVLVAAGGFVAGRASESRSDSDTAVEPTASVDLQALDIPEFTGRPGNPVQMTEYVVALIGESAHERDPNILFYGVASPERDPEDLEALVTKIGSEIADDGRVDYRRFTGAENEDRETTPVTIMNRPSAINEATLVKDGSKSYNVALLLSYRTKSGDFSQQWISMFITSRYEVTELNQMDGWGVDYIRMHNLPKR